MGVQFRLTDANLPRTVRCITLPHVTSTDPVGVSLLLPSSGEDLNSPVGLSLIPWDSLVAQKVKSLPAMRVTRVQSLGWENPLEKDMATHSSILAWRIPQTEEPGGLRSMESQRVGHN